MYDVTAKSKSAPGNLIDEKKFAHINTKSDIQRLIHFLNSVLHEIYFATYQEHQINHH